jgi:signal transduction histidine kinase
LRFKAYISRIIHRVTLFIGLRGSLAADETARMLHVLIAALAVWLAAGWVATIPFASMSFPRIFNTVVMEASYATALVLLRLGHFRRASLAYLAATWIWATLVSFSFGGVHIPGALLYVSLPASAAWLLGYKAGIWTAGGCLLGALVFTVLEMTHASFSFQRQSTPLGTWFIIVQSVLINAIPVGQIIGRLRETITELRRAEAASRQSHEEIAHLNRVAAMGELTASLAHELNQPLAAILSNAQAAIRYLSGEPADLAEVRECLTDIVADDKRAGEVIRTLRALLRKEESQASLIDLNEVVTEAIRLLGSDATLRHTSVKFEPLPAFRLVLGDRTQLYQVVLNLIKNGLEAAAERSPDNRWVLVRTAESDGGIELTVEDSGRGITEGDLARVFEPFFTTKQEGLGMGLSISRTIVQAQGGRIWAENRPGSGAIFRCVLPMAQQVTAASVRRQTR